MGLVALNYIYLSEKHAGGKDQVGLNLLRGFYEQGKTKNMLVICYEYTKSVILKYAPDVKIIALKNPKIQNELGRMLSICYVNSVVIPKLIKKYRIRVLYHLSCNNGLRKLKTKSIVIPHDIKAVSHRVLANVKIPFIKHFIYKVMYAVDFKHADCIIAISNTDKGEISKYYPSVKNKIVRIYNPIDFERKVIDGEKKKKDIVAINLQFHHKNVITLIKAFELIKDKTECNLILIGNVPDRVKYLKEYVASHNLDDRIIFKGFVEDEERNYLLENCRLYVNPTLYEGFGMTAVEAIILGVPTLVSKIPTNYEVTQGLCEYYYPPEDEKVLAEKLIECLNKKYSSDVLEESSKRIYELYNYRHISKLYLRLFRAVMERE